MLACTAFKEWTKRHTQLKEKPDSAVSDAITKILTRARITTMEYEFLASIVVASDPKQQRASVNAINASIELLGKAKLEIDDIHATVWGFAQKVLRGERLSDT